MSFELGINLCTKGVCMWSCALSYIPFRLMLDTFVLFRTWMYTIETDLLSSWQLKNLQYTITVLSSSSLYQLKDIGFSQGTPSRAIASLIITGWQYRILMQSWYKLPVSCYWNVSYAVGRMYSSSGGVRAKSHKDKLISHLLLKEHKWFLTYMKGSRKRLH